MDTIEATPSPRRWYSSEELRAILAEQTKANGGVNAYARSLSMSPGNLCDILKGRKEVGPLLIRKLGGTLETFYSLPA
jgi:hypothetical protein